MESLRIILDFRLQLPVRRVHRGLRSGGILDLWNRYALIIFTTPGVGRQCSAQPPAKKTADQIEKETLAI